MKTQVALVAAMGICIFITFSTLYADDNLDAYEGVKDIKIGGHWFLTYLTGKVNTESRVNEFVINRGYINVYKKLSENLVGRITPDVSVDHEGDGLGDVELRLKYAYLITKLKDLGFLKKPYFEFGLVHRPWIDYEQHINQYRVQGTMFLERVKLFNSADFGVTFTSFLGGELEEEYQQVSKAYPGKFGSFSIGIYNGGGYHAIEVNENKPVETRLSLRPLNKKLPGLQFHYTGAYGKGNSDISPDWYLNAGMVSFESPRFTFTGQYFFARGNSYGSYVDDDGVAKPSQGYSVFGDFKIPTKNLTLFARYDYWNGNEGESVTHRTIAGAAYHFVDKSKVLIDYDLYRESSSGDAKSGFFELAIEIKF